MKEASAPSILEDDGHCFVCGGRNPKGLGLSWTVSGKETAAEFTPGKEHQGWKDVVHGGLLATVLDEAMTRLVWKVHGAAMTAEMTVRYLAPAKVGETLQIRGRIVDDARRLILAEASVTRPDGAVAARAEGKALKLS